MHVQSPQAPRVPSALWWKQFWAHYHTSLLTGVIAGGLLIGGVSIVWHWHLFDQDIPRVEFQAVYSLVPDQISQSANIVATLPDGIDRDVAKLHLAFTPGVDGTWSDGPTDRQLTFHPKKQLSLQKHYILTLTTAAGTIGKDFLVTEDPAVAAVFPGTDSEADESSKITVVFTRPMIPLTTLSETDQKEIPVTITPATPGTLKWIGTRTVQFIPKDRLIRASKYTVTVAGNAQSEDGVPLPSFSSSFDTRHLRYAFQTEGPIVYNQPMEIRFNQPVDLGRTAKEITVQNTTKNQPTDIVIEYGTVQVYNATKHRYDTQTDESSLVIFQKTDSHGRKKLWDFTNSYSLHIAKAYPKEGDLNLEEERTFSIHVTDVVDSVTAVSARSNAVTPDVFDPQGKLAIRFFEDINIKKSSFTASKPFHLSYGEKCRELGLGEEQQVNNDPSTCEKEPDLKVVFFAFDGLQPGETVPMSLGSVVNTHGVTINPAAITESITAAPQLQLLSTRPTSGTAAASVTELILCTNTPLVAPEKGHADRMIQASAPYEFTYWSPSYRVQPNPPPEYAGCHAKEFETHIQYRLMPNTAYTLHVTLTDHFESTTTSDVSFSSGDMPQKYLNFYHFQKDSVVTTPDKTAFTYAGENMTSVDVQVCQLSPEAYAQRLTKRVSYLDPPSVIGECLRTVTKHIELPKRYWVKNIFTVDLKDYVVSPLGQYVITFSNPRYTEWTENGRQIYERTYVSVTNLSVVEKQVDVHQVSMSDGYGYDASVNLPTSTATSLASFYWITDMKSLAPVADARVSVYPTKSQQDGYGTPTIATTDNKGVATMTAVVNRGLVVVKNGNDSAILLPTSQLGWNDWARTADRLYVYTDRPIYRPGDAVNIKGLYRIGYDGSYEIFRDKKVHVTVFDAADKQVFADDLPVNDFGTINTTFTLPVTAAVGTYRIETDGRGWGYFDVEEYVGAPFKVETKNGKEEYMAGDTFHVSVDANYYFGVPVEGGTVEYSVVSQDYYFDKYRGDDYFQFGRGWYSCYDSCSYGDAFLLRGTVPIGKDGKADISGTLDWKRFFPDEKDQGSKILAVYVRVKNTTGQSIAGQQSFIVHGANYYLGLNTHTYFSAKNQPVTMNMKSVDVTGMEKSVSSVAVTWNKVHWAEFKRREVDGSYYYRTERQLLPVSTMTANTDRHGNWSGTYTPTEEGEYEVDARGVDSKGNVVLSSYVFYVYGEGQADVRPTNDTSLELVSDKTDLKVGDTASFIIKSPYPTAKALISIERGSIYHYEIVDIKQNFYKYAFPITEAYVPNVYVSVVLLSPKPEIKYGQVSYSVDVKDKNLSIIVSTDKKEYLPGETVKLHVEAKDVNGSPVEAEFSTAVVDMSVLALKGNPKKNPVLFFYDGFPLTIATESNVKDILYKVDVPNNTKGGGGGAPDDLAKKKRGVFKDTAFWNAVIHTSSNGTADVEFTLPDNLTTWQVEGVALTKDTKLGVGYSELMSKKKLMLTPLEPRFIIPGDTFMVGAKVFNETGRTQSLSVSFESPTLSLTNDKAQKTVTVKDHETKIVYFSLTAPGMLREGVHAYTLSAKNTSFEDTVERSIKIEPNTTYETVATAAASTAPEALESIFIPGNIEPDRGELTIHTSASLSVFLSDALKYLISYPNGTAEEVASKLDAMAILKTSLAQLSLSDQSLDMVSFDGKSYTTQQAAQIGLTDLLTHQNTNGGFSYYPPNYYWYNYSYDPSNIFLSMYVGRALKHAKDAGFPVDDQTYQALYGYLTNFPSQHANWYRYDNDLKIVLASTLSVMQGPGHLPESSVNDVRSALKDAAFLKEHISNSTLATLAILLAQEERTFGKKVGDQVYTLLQNRLDIDARGTYLSTNSNLQWQCYETPIRNTALFLNALALGHRDTPVTDRVLRWLLSSRDKDGAWGSTPNTLAVVEAMSNYSAALGEQKSAFTLATLFNGAPQSSVLYATSTLWSQNQIVIPMNAMARNQVSAVTFQKANHNKERNGYYYDVSLHYFLPIETIPPRDEGFTITRGVYRLDDTAFEHPLEEGKVGDLLTVHGEIVVPRSRNFMTISDYIPAGAEVVNTKLATEAAITQVDGKGDWRSQEPKLTYPLYPNVFETRDDRVYMGVEHLEPGTYSYEYTIRLLVPGTYHHLPAIVSEDYFPENFGRTAGSLFTVKQ